MKSQQQQIEKLEKRIRYWGEKLGTLVAKADAAEPAVSPGYRTGIDELKLKYQLVQTKIETLKAVGEKHGDTLKNDIELAWRDLHKAFNELESPKPD